MRQVLILAFFHLLFVNSNAQNPTFRGDVLLIGDSTFLANNSADLFQKIANNSGDSFHVEVIYIQDSVCWKLANDKNYSKKLNNRSGFIFIQENTRRLVTTDYYDLRASLSTIKGEIAKSTSCAYPVLVQNWAYKNGDTGLCKKYSMCCNFKSMNNSFIDYSSLVTKGIFNYLPLASTWKASMDKNPGIDLFNNDGKTPSSEGSYLISQALYDFSKTIFSEALSTKVYNHGLGNSVETSLRKISLDVFTEQGLDCRNIISAKYLGIEYNFDPFTGDYLTFFPMDASGNMGGQSGVYYDFSVYKNNKLISVLHGSNSNYYISDSNTSDYTVCMKVRSGNDSCDEITTCKSLIQFYPYYHRGQLNTIPHFFYHDKNSNCTYESGEETLYFPTNYQSKNISFTNAGVPNTDTLKFLLSKDTYLISSLTKAAEIRNCASQYLISDSIHALKTQAIPVKMNGSGQDLAIHFYQDQGWNPGYGCSGIIAVNNNGIKKSKAVIKLEKPDSLIFLTSDLTPTINTGKKLEWSMDLPAGQSGDFIVKFRLSSKYKITDTIHLHLLCDTILNDMDSSDNRQFKHIQLNGSYDPNFKEVNNPDALDTKSPVVYKIHFQNTGTAPARNIVVVDTLQNKCKIKSIKVTGTSHPCTLAMSNNILRFQFININLADSGTNQEASHGFVEFEMALQDPGMCDSISNRASIYFDFNPPIITNTTFIHLKWPLGAHPVQKGRSNGILIWPNPGTQSLNVQRFNYERSGSFLLLDLNGKLIETVVLKQGETTGYFQLSEALAAGVYFVKDEKGNCLKWIKL